MSLLSSSTPFAARVTNTRRADIAWMLLTRLVKEAGPHIAAIGVTTLVVATVPIVTYALLVVVGILVQGDPGGWLNFILVPVGSLLLGLSCAIAFIPLSVIALRLGKPAIVAPLAVALLALGTWEVVLGGLPPSGTVLFHVIGGTLAIGLGAAFLVYLSVLLVSRKIVGVVFGG